MRRNPSLISQRGGLLFWALIILIGAAIGALVTFELVIKRLQAQLLVTDEQLYAYVDQPLTVTASVRNELKISIDEVVSTSVPVDTTLSVPVEDALSLIADFNAVVPISTVVPVDDVIPLEQDIDIDTVVEADLLGETFKLPLRGRFPVRAEVPVRLMVPIDQDVRLAFTAPIQARLKQNLIVPLKTTIVADVPLKTEMSVPVLNDVAIDVEIPHDPVLPVKLNYADLNIPLHTIRFSLDDQPASERGEAQP